MVKRQAWWWKACYKTGKGSEVTSTLIDTIDRLILDTNETRTGTTRLHDIVRPRPLAPSVQTASKLPIDIYCTNLTTMMSIEGWPKLTLVHSTSL